MAAHAPASASGFDPELLRRYDRPGPRYTSYPTAPQFRTDFPLESLRARALESNAQLPARALSLYVHIPFCASPCFYCGCNRIITRDLVRGEHYVEQLLAELNLVAPWFEAGRPVTQLHLGGGTPNFLSPRALERLIRGIGARLATSSADTRDFSVELDPRFVTEEHLAVLGALGFNRASLGVQDFAPEVQQAIHRTQSIEQTLAAIESCRRYGLRSVNVDLIYGLPRQRPEGFARTLEALRAARPERFAIYGYAHLPQNFKAQRRIPAGELPDAAARLALLALAIETLTARGYAHIGLDHFALPEDELAVALKRGTLQRNFMGYTTHADCDLLALGVSAISHIGSCFSQSLRELPAWERALAAHRVPLWRGLELDADDLLRAELIQQVMCRGAIDVRAFEERFGIEFAAYFASSLPRLAALEADGLLVRDARQLRATPAGRFLLRNIAMCFDRYLEAAPEAAAPKRYSQAL